MHCEVAWCCTTPRHKTHKPEFLAVSAGEAIVAYRWHPWFGKSVRIHEVIERTAGAAARCSREAAPRGSTQEIPVWMLDAASCASMRASAYPVAAVSALAALGRLLLEMTTHSTTLTEVAPKMRVRCDDHHSGDRHAAPVTPNDKPPTRPLRGECTAPAGGNAQLDDIAGSDAERADGADDTDTGRSCRRRGDPAGERRR